MRETTLRPTKTILTVAVLVATTFGLAACSSSGAPTGTGTSARGGAGGSGGGDGAGAALGACLRDAGFDVTDPTDEQAAQGLVEIPDGADQEAFGEAVGTCREGGGTSESRARADEFARQYAKVASCIQENGFPDFPPSEDGGLSRDDYARSDEPEFLSTFDECLAKYSPDTKTVG